VRYQSSDADTAPRSPKHPPGISAWTLELLTNNIPQIAERSRGRSGVKAAHARAAARSRDLTPALYASAHISQYPGNVINGGAAISSPHEP
jgi:hypothetical protein